MKKFLIPGAVLAILAIAIVYFYTSNNSQGTENSTPSIKVSESSSPMMKDSNMMHAFAYKDGTYSVDGHYVSPGGPRDIGVTITLEGDTITDAIFEGRATDPNSKRFQGEFRDNFKTFVIGKKIDEVQLTKVAGSSLTPKGFNDALEQIKVKAQS